MTVYRWGKGPRRRLPLKIAKLCIHLEKGDIFAFQGKRAGKRIRSRYTCGLKPVWRGESDTVHVSRTCVKCGKWLKKGGITRRLLDLFLSNQRILPGPFDGIPFRPSSWIDDGAEDGPSYQDGDLEAWIR